MFDENLTMEQKEQIVRYLMKCYRKADNRIRRYEELNCVAENIEDYRSDKTTCMLVDDAVRELNSSQQLIIRNEYMHPLDCKWYTEYFSRSTYQRLKIQAVDKFLRCLQA